MFDYYDIDCVWKFYWVLWTHALILLFFLSNEDYIFLFCEVACLGGWSHDDSREESFGTQFEFYLPE